jgi:hypothetical protein
MKEQKKAASAAKKILVCVICNQRYEMRSCFDKHVLGKHVNFKTVIAEQVKEQVEEQVEAKVKLVVDKLEKRFDILSEEQKDANQERKKIRLELDNVRAQSNVLKRNETARSSEKDDWGKNLSRSKVLLFSGLRRAKKGENKIDIVAEFLNETLAPLLLDVVSDVSAVSFLSGNKKHTLKVEFKTENVATKILQASVDQKIENIKEYINFNTVVRRLILDVYAKNLTSDEVRVTSSEIGNYPS